MLTLLSHSLSTPGSRRSCGIRTSGACTRRTGSALSRASGRTPRSRAANTCGRPTATTCGSACRKAVYIMLALYVLLSKPCAPCRSPSLHLVLLPMTHIASNSHSRLEGLCECMLFALTFTCAVLLLVHLVSLISRLICVAVSRARVTARWPPSGWRHAWSGHRQSGDS